MTERYLTDERWALVAELLPGKVGDPGRSGKDNRLFLEAVLWVARNQAPWRNLPAEFGKWYTTYTRYNRWSKADVWAKVFAALAKDSMCEYVFEEGEVRWKPLNAIVAASKMEPIKHEGDRSAA